MWQHFGRVVGVRALAGNDRDARSLDTKVVHRWATRAVEAVVEVAGVVARTAVERDRSMTRVLRGLTVEQTRLTAVLQIAVAIAVARLAREAAFVVHRA